MPALQRGAAWAEERLSGALRQFVPQNGRVHLHIIVQTVCLGSVPGTVWGRILTSGMSRPHLCVILHRLHRQSAGQTGHFHGSNGTRPRDGCGPEVGVSLVAHDCGYPLSRYTCRATRVAADFLDCIVFCRCSTGVALHPLKILVSHLPPPRAGRCRTEIWV